VAVRRLVVVTERRADETVAELESRGLTQLEIECAACGHIARMSLFLLRTRRHITPEMTFEAVVSRVSCTKCKAKPNPESVRPMRQETSPDRPRKVRKDSL
jgi:hypothetical protein